MEQAVVTKPMTLKKVFVLTLVSLLIQLLLYALNFYFVMLTLDLLFTEEFSGHVPKPMSIETFVPLILISMTIMIAAGYLFKKSYYYFSWIKAEIDYGYMYCCGIGCTIQLIILVFFFIHGFNGDVMEKMVKSTPFWLMFFLSVQAYIKIRKNKQATA